MTNVEYDASLERITHETRICSGSFFLHLYRISTPLGEVFTLDWILKKKANKSSFTFCENPIRPAMSLSSLG